MREITTEDFLSLMPPGLREIVGELEPDGAGHAHVHTALPLTEPEVELVGDPALDAE